MREDVGAEEEHSTDEEGEEAMQRLTTQRMTSCNHLQRCHFLSNTPPPCLTKERTSQVALHEEATWICCFRGYISDLRQRST